MITLVALLIAPASAGYGDVRDGYPSWAERELHLYTNAVRVDPEAFDAEYSRGGCGFDDFQSDEQTPQAPLHYSYPLNDAARYHSQDMKDSGNFSHDSSDGTSFGARLAQFYPESSYVGENIAYGYQDNWQVLMQGWMCSSGHRANIMHSGYRELGTGVVSNYYTQDFGGGNPDTDSGVRMGVHTPERAAAGDQLTAYADWAGRDLEILALVLDGEVFQMDLEWGQWDSGVFRVEATLPDVDCADYYFVYEAGGTRGAFPEFGAYLVGPGCSGDWEERDETLSPWAEDNVDDDSGGSDGRWGEAAGDDGNDDVNLKSCATTPTAPAAGLLTLVGLALTRRRQR